jgi:hypothetical protein
MSGSLFETAFNLNAHGEQAGSVSAAQFPSQVCRLAKFKAQAANPTFVAIGKSSAVTLPAGTTDTTSGWPLDAGEETDWLPCANLNEFWYICTAAGDHVSFMVAG